MLPLPFTRQELRALLVLGATGLVGITALFVTRVAPPAQLSAVVAVNLNVASAEELAALRGIGPALARRIVEDREAHGRFLRVEDVGRVKGLSPKVVAELKSRLTVE